jgi:hypothetical protein
LTVDFLSFTNVSIVVLTILDELDEEEEEDDDDDALGLSEYMDESILVSSASRCGASGALRLLFIKPA